MVRPLLWFVLLCACLAFATCVDAEKCADEDLTHRRLASRTVNLPESQYFAEYAIGDPPQRAVGIIDTGSSLVWTQSAGCGACFGQSLPRYDPSASRTVRNVTCGDPLCAAGLGSVTECSRSGTNECHVHTVYNAFEEIAGDLRTDEFTFGSSEKVKSLAFGRVGASTLTAGSLDGASGMIGLGRGGLSLVSQLGDDANRKFSYCLTPFFRNVINPSNLLVGHSAVLSGGGAPVTSVPFLKNPEEAPYNTYYYVPLAGITVGTARLDVPAAAFDLRQVKLVDEGKWAWAGTVVHSRTAFTTLVDVAYQALRAELERQLGASLVRPPRVILGRKVTMCVTQADFKRLVPPMVLHFDGGGGDVVLPPENYWAPVGDDTACLVVFSSADRMWPRNETTIIGSFLQQNMQLLYDLGEGRLSFQKTDCSSFKPADPGPSGTGNAKKSGSASASSSSSSPAPLPHHVFSLMSLLMLNGAPGVRGI